MEHCANGVQTCRAIATLIALTGNIDIPGGNVYHSRPKQASFKVEARAPLQDALGTEFPIYTRFIGMLPSQPIDGDPAKLLPQVLDQLVVLGDLARQISHSLGGNGQRAEAMKELVAILSRK